MLFGKLRVGCQVPFTEEWLLSANSNIDGVLQRWSVRVTIGFLISSLTKTLLSQSLRLVELPALGRVLVVQNVFNLQVIKCSLGPVVYLSSDLCFD